MTEELLQSIRDLNQRNCERAGTTEAPSRPRETSVAALIEEIQRRLAGRVRARIDRAVARFAERLETLAPSISVGELDDPLLKTQEIEYQEGVASERNLMSSAAWDLDDRLDRIDGDVDIIDALFKPLPSWIVAHYLGVPEADRARFDGWTDAIVAADAGGDVRAAGKAVLELFEFATELIEFRRSNPGADLVSDLVESGDDRASVRWILGFVFTMITGGNDTTTGLLGGAAELLQCNPDQRQVLVDEPGLIRPSVDEFLRLTSPVQNLARTTTRDVRLHGVEIPAGRKVMLAYAAANRDEREFDATAGALDVRRDLKRMLSFGYGPHLCLGASVARLAAGIALERLLTRFPAFSVDPEVGRFAPGPYVRRYESLPFKTGRHL